ncbi:MAG: family 20 glycosylhydrolase [Myxococcota bacterium]|nr:family 20 glycosylhydrolase [Myxococcota bacterium]
MATRLPPLLPRPDRAEPTGGHFALAVGTPLVLRAGSAHEDFQCAERLRDRLATHTGRVLCVETHERLAELGPRIELVRRGDAGEAYAIEVGREAIRIEGDGAAGLRHGATTLAQLVDSRGRIPCCRIEDAPRFGLRGVMLDVSRGKVPSDASLRELVDRCAALKLNALMLYTEHTFRFRRHPEIGADASPLTAESLRALDQYAAERGVELIPTLQALGHMGHVLKLPRYAHLAESELGWSLSPAEPGTYELIDDLLDEYLPNFRSGYWNANCDEPWDLGRGKSKAREAELGPGGVYVEHVKRLHAAARARDRRLMIWGDVVHSHPEQVEHLPRDLVMLDWWYEAQLDFDRVRVFAERGIPFVVCPGTSTWNCLFPRVANSLANISGWADAGRRHDAMGLVCTDWGDFGHYNLLGNSWLAYAWAAQEAWSGPVDEKAFDQAFDHQVFGGARGAARAYRMLGDVHDAGFPVFNGSALQFLFFDDVDRAFFHRQARSKALERSGRRLDAFRERLAGMDALREADPLTFDEIDYALDASRFAVAKSLAALEWLAWREDPASLDARARKRLAKRLAALADEQRVLGRTLKRLWDARSRPSNFEITGTRIRKSVASLRRAARALERGRAPAPPRDDTELRDVFRELRVLCEGL